MKTLASYLQQLEKKNPGSSKSVADSVSRFSLQHLENYDYLNHKSGILLGHVQSGKTSHLLGIIAEAVDKGFKLFILLTTDNTRLQEQTIIRTKLALQNVVICGEADTKLFAQNAFQLPVIIVLKKNPNILRSWHRRIVGLSKSNLEPLILIDDEADAASLNTKVNANSVSTINDLIIKIIHHSPSSLYLQCTATPYANLLLNSKSKTMPSFVHCIQPGPGYLGGDFFYGENSKAIEHINDEGDELADPQQVDLPIGLRRATCEYLKIIISYMKQGKDSCNFLVHPSHKIDVHDIVEKKIMKYLSFLKKEALAKNPLMETLVGIPGNPISIYSDVISAIERIKVIQVNSNSISEDYNTGFNVIVGGNSLGRGVTFPNLNVCYYVRSTKTPQADTLWQHSRVFGYDRDVNFVKLFIPYRLLLSFRSISDSNNKLHEYLSSGQIGDMKILMPIGIRPTRKTVVSVDSTVSLVGGVNYFLQDTDGSNTAVLDKCILEHPNIERINIFQLKEIFSAFKSSDSLLLKNICSALDMINETNSPDLKIYVRTDRNISRGTGTLLSQTDRALTTLDQEKLVVFFYRLNGAIIDGWNGAPLWIPNIRFPVKTCFFGVSE